MNTIEEHEDLCLESKTKFFFEKHTESSDEGELLDIAQNVSETKGNYDQNQWMLDSSITGLWNESWKQTSNSCKERVLLCRFLKNF